MKYVNTSVEKKDAMALVTGQPVYTDDLAPKDCLIVKLLRSPHAHALIEEIDTQAAFKVPGIACILTYQDVPQDRFTFAGQTYPELSPYDRLILDQRVRFVGDAVAIVAGENEKAVDKALKLIKVKYQVLEAVLDFHEAKDNPIVIHPEDNWESRVPVGADNKRNLCAAREESSGDVEAVLKACKYTIDRTYHTKANQQAMMETFRSYTYLDHFGRMNVVTSTQVPFHVRRILGRALGIGASNVRVIKPRIGGGFGAKQTSVTEVYPAIVTLKTKKPAKLVYSRYESQICSSPRHEMEVRVRLGADEHGILKAMDIHTLSNTGAYGEHGPTTVGLSGHKPLGLYGKKEAYRFTYEVVYTNRMSAGAYRGYGATQGIFAVESAVDELAHEMGMDPVKFRELNLSREGDPFLGYDGCPVVTSCTLDKCVEKAKEMIGWDEKYPVKDMGNGKVRAVGAALAMQGSSIAGVDIGGAEVKLGEDGSYTLNLGATDMGTGCDTILSQMAADILETDIDNIIAFGVDTDVSPYDSGSYASATTYVTGMAVTDACQKLRAQIQKLGAEMLEKTPEEVDFDGKVVYELDGDRKVTLEEIAVKGTCGNNVNLQASATRSSKISPPPFMVGMAEVEIDKETGSLELLDYVAVVDCGTPINPNLARVQTEGGIGQGIGMALYEDIQYNEKGQLRNNSFMQYKIPTRQDVGKIRVEFAPSYEKSHPFGAKSIGEIVINTPCPAIANAVDHAVGVRIREMPITAEKIAMELLKRQENK
ncbi:xanthine dehydrogenase family protein molybdopterin-binding subunit [Blautia sp.]|uniref:xanthine dehydrogenase family protein molybdopterin-binding subunit n=1 Tax=Blautia sp. TaxID=1955243 RepID=UPI002631CB7D|nr:molybdopterin cofactor-binding domain-containing protein [Blautia sp.]